MSGLRPLPLRKVLAVLEAAGFRRVAQRGSHLKLRHPDGRVVVVPVHPGRDLKVSLLRRLAAQAGIDADAFREA